MLEEEEKFNLEYAKIREKQNEILLQKMKIEESKQRRRNQIAKFSQDFVDRVIATSAVSLSRIDPKVLYYLGFPNQPSGGRFYTDKPIWFI